MFSSGTLEEQLRKRMKLPELDFTTTQRCTHPTGLNHDPDCDIRPSHVVKLLDQMYVKHVDSRVAGAECGRRLSRLEEEGRMQDYVGTKSGVHDLRLGFQEPREIRRLPRLSHQWKSKLCTVVPILDKARRFHRIIHT